MPVTISLLELDNRRVVYNETHSNGTFLRFDENHVLEKNRAYRLTVRVNESRSWDVVVKHHEVYELRVAKNGSVSIEQYMTA